MTTDDEPAGMTHLHVLGQRDDLQRARITLTAAVLAMHDDWSSELARDLVMDCLLQLTALCKIEIRVEDRW